MQEMYDEAGAIRRGGMLDTRLVNLQSAWPSHEQKLLRGFYAARPRGAKAKALRPLMRVLRRYLSCVESRTLAGAEEAMVANIAAESHQAE